MFVSVNKDTETVFSILRHRLSKRWFNTQNIQIYYGLTTDVEHDSTNRVDCIAIYPKDVKLEIVVEHHHF